MKYMTVIVKEDFFAKGLRSSGGNKMSRLKKSKFSTFLLNIQFQSVFRGIMIQSTILNIFECKN